MHGIIRKIDVSDGDIYEYTVNRGDWYGLYRYISKSNVAIVLHKDKENLASMYFRHNFEEYEREDPDNLLPGPKIFKKEGKI